MSRSQSRAAGINPLELDLQRWRKQQAADETEPRGKVALSTLRTCSRDLAGSIGSGSHTSGLSGFPNRYEELDNRSILGWMCYRITVFLRELISRVSIGLVNQ